MNRRAGAAILVPLIVLIAGLAALVWFGVVKERERAEREHAAYVEKMRSVIAWLPEAAEALTARVVQVERYAAGTEELDLRSDLALASAAGQADAQELLRRAHDLRPPPEFAGFHLGLIEALTLLRSAEVELALALGGPDSGACARAKRALAALPSLAERLHLELR